MRMRIRKIWIALLVSALILGGLGNPVNVTAGSVTEGNPSLNAPEDSLLEEGSSMSTDEAEDASLQDAASFLTVSGGDGATEGDSENVPPTEVDPGIVDSETGVSPDKNTEDTQAEGLDYALGRPLTAEELQKQKELFDYYSHLGGGIVLPEELPEDNVLPASMREVWGTLPAEYDSRNVNGRNLVPEIRDQNPHGTCWSFSSLACLEINLIKNGLADRDIDLSEYHLAFFSNFSAPDPLGNDGDERSYYDADKAGGVSYLDRGGNQVMAANALMNWKGAADESLVTREMAEAGLNAEDSGLAYGNDIYYLENWYRFPAADEAAMKAAIMQYGSVSINYYSDDQYYNYQTAAEYCPDDIGTNHAVTIIGWDDSFKRGNFLEEPVRDGAWLVRNSWGDWYGEEGYFWLSYEDKSIYEEAYAFAGQKTDAYDNNYQYDHATSSGYMRVGRAANVYVAKGNGNRLEELKAVGISLFSAGVSYSVQIYTNLTDASDPTSGDPAFPTPLTGITGYAGYYIIPLRESILLEPEDTFSVVFDLKTDSGEAAFVECEYPVEGYRYSGAEANPEESFYGNDNGSWVDFGGKWDMNLKIKAYTENTNVEWVKCQGISLKSAGDVIAVGNRAQCSVTFNPVNVTNKSLIWSSSDPSVATVDANGIVTGIKAGKARITVTAKKSGHSANWDVTVVQPVTSVSVRYNVADGYYVGDVYEPIVEIGPSDATDKSLVWSSSNDGVATVDGNGTITVAAKGSAVITATAKSRVSASVTIEAKEDIVRAFAKRMYTKALGRKEDAAGLADWTSRLKNREIDGAGIAGGFIGSEEFENRKLSNGDYVDTLYRTFFDREADKGGRADWMGRLAAGNSRESVLSGFVNSEEFSKLCDRYGIARGTMQEDGSVIYRPGVRDFVLRLYLKALKRQGETMGVEDWTNRINMGQMTAEDVAKSFFFSEEFEEKKLSDEDFVETLYQTFMDRASDQAGKADWVSQLKNGKSREQVLEGFSRSREFGDIMAEYGL